MKHNFHSSRENRLARYQQLQENNMSKSDDLLNQSSELGSQIPLGQPILVGHHSETGHRRHLEKIQDSTRESIKAADKAKYYAERVKIMESNTAISSDDPEAITKLEQKEKTLSELQSFMKSANKCIK